MNALLVVLSLILCGAVSLFVEGGAAAMLFCALLSLGVMKAGSSIIDDQRRFLLQIFVAALLLRVLLGAVIYAAHLQDFFGGDAYTYDSMGRELMAVWGSRQQNEALVNSWREGGTGWGMGYLVAYIYYFFGVNMLAVQMFNAVVGAATAPIIFLCARHIFENLRVARLAAFAVAFYPSLVLWSAQGLKDGPIVFLLAVAMYATLKLGERMSPGYLTLLIVSMAGMISLRFYIFYMLSAAVAGSFVIGMRKLTGQSLTRQFVVVVAVGLALTYVGVLRTASQQFERYGNLQAVQVSRADLATSAGSGFGKDVDVSTTRGALTAIPVGMAYLLFAPFPWQLTSLRQSITLPEMILWWASFPLLVAGVWFTLRHRMRRALPILIFTAMLTLAYSVFQGNVGTAYRQRSQLLVFYFIFVAVGAVLVKERSEDRRRAQAAEAAAAAARAARQRAGMRRYQDWKQSREQEYEEMARSITERVDF
ncbi:MAG: glycosyltransferase family 39 protein [Acidobacteria bacterium]|nr:glycosyltransferase family 39 protein [Acidobacteriota bacterium]